MVRFFSTLILWRKTAENSLKERYLEISGFEACAGFNEVQLILYGSALFLQGRGRIS